MTKPHLAFFAHDLRGGGAERAVVRLVNAMARRDVLIDLVLVKKEGAFLQELDARVRLVSLPGRRTATSFIGLKRYLNEAKPAALISAMTHINISSVIARMLSKHKPKLILVEHNQFDRNFALKKGLVRLAYKAVPFLYRQADVIAGVSEGVRESIADVIGVPPEHLSVLYNPVVTPELTEQSLEKPDHMWLENRDRPVILAVGRLSKSKNYPLLLDAFSLLVQNVAARLIILGEGELRDTLVAQANALGIIDRVDFAGFRQNPFSYMSSCNVFVMSSDWEGHPTVMLEAMACGAPIVSTDCRSGPSEILAGGKFGRLVPTGDARALASALEATIANPGRAEPRIARANEFNDNASVDAYLAAAGYQAARLNDLIST